MPKLILARLIGATHPTLYTSSLFGLNFASTGVGNLNILADNRQGISQSGFLFIRDLSYLLMGVANSCDLSHGYQYGRISYTVKPCPPAVGSGHMVFLNNILEANHA